MGDQETIGGDCPGEKAAADPGGKAALLGQLERKLEFINRFWSKQGQRQAKTANKNLL